MPQPEEQQFHHEEDTARQSRNRKSEYLPQRRKGRKGKRIVISTEGRNLSQIPRIRSG